MFKIECLEKGLQNAKELSSKLESFKDLSLADIITSLKGLEVEIEDCKEVSDGLLVGGSVAIFEVNYKNIGVTVFAGDNFCHIGGTIEVFDDEEFKSNRLFDIETLEYYLSKANVA